MKSDEELMQDYRGGSEEAFNALYDKYADLVYGHVRKRIREREADDVYQKVWRHLHEKRFLYQGQPFAPWLFVLIRNLITDEYRSLGRRDRELPGYVPETAAQLEDTHLEELLGALHPDSRELVRKYYLEGFTTEDLEQETGLTEANIRQRLSRAIRSLRKINEE